MYNKSRMRKGLTALTVSLMMLPTASMAAEKAKNIILMIGDGMGPQQMGLLESYARMAPSSIYKGQKTAMQQLADDGHMGLSLPNPAGALVVDSASSASQLATGIPAPSEALGVDPQGNSVETILEKAKRMGKATGLISDTRLTHATPAAFAAHQPHRSLENEIAAQMLENGVDVMLSGGIRHWIPQVANEKGAVYKQLVDMTGGTVKIKSKRKDNRNLLLEAKDAGYDLAFNRNALEKANGDKLLGLFSYSGMLDGIAYSNSKNSRERTQPSLKEMTVKALDILSQDEDGFFLMVEGGQIDWAGHNNDAGTMLHELLKFDEAVDAVRQWAADRDDTLVVVTADHETGSFGFSYSASNLPKASKLPGKVFAERDFKPNFNFGAPEILDNLYNQKKSFYGMISAYNGIPKAERTPATLAKVVNENSSFDIDERAAARILTKAPNPYQVDGHKYMATKTLPKVNDFRAFFVYGDEIQMNLLARELAEKQNTVWGTGTHTSTPVAVIAHGDDDLIKAFGGIKHHTDIGKILISAL
ncbi:alkaline phosphatase [Sansalvadorimonas sp. 2012CJ34-2]|uniref:Alkaline phosphatase n=1 Tax=Parendozoicomonas callyspongiae TaxID=2942213 RepID=A0ABT0PD00_9GAMM|nr:alkaline phosphatase [Sansalvadorimonas sp. 2012CJ34-2]MCL6269234.1 alkaline phosphatase [Sansalvadorimonas sp. 2012CJ34-2]